MTIARPLHVEPVITAALILIIAPVTLAQPSQEDLAKAAQNPIANLISVPIQSNNDFDWDRRVSCSKWVWGVGPAIQLPTASDDA